MVIGFTGHRDCLCDLSDLNRIVILYPAQTWVHGGAKGFDEQVEKFAKNMGLRTMVIPPDYQTYGGSAAPLKRDEEIVRNSDMLVAMWDGRTTGGTWYTVTKAVQKRIPVILIPVKRKIEQGKL
jgi:hypothetical protein